MNTRRRVAIEVLLPPLVGGAIAIVPGIYFQPENALLTAAVYLAGSYYIATIPSIAYAACMEGVFKLGLKPQSKMSVVLSSVLGLFAGIAIVIVGILGKSRAPSFDDFYFCVPVGVFSGALVGWIVYALERLDERRKNA